MKGRDRWGGREGQSSGGLKKSSASIERGTYDLDQSEGA